MFDFLAPTLSKNTIINDGIDCLVFERILQQSNELKLIKEKGTEILKTFPYLQEDVFFSLYKFWPELLNAKKVSPECAVNRHEMEKLLEAPSYKELRQYTQLDEFGAGLGSKALLEELCNRLKDDNALQEAVEQVNQAAEHQKKAEELQNKLSNSPGKKDIQQAMQAAQQAAMKAEKLLAGAQSQLRRTVTAAAEKAVGELEETEAVITAWGFNRGQFQQLPFEKKMEIVKVLRTQEKFKKMTSLVGRMRNIALAAQKAKIDDSRVELHSITTGDDIARALTQELAVLRKPALKLNFYRKFYEKQLLQYDLSHKDKAGCGPIVCLIDSSGSMAEARDEWAKAVAMGLLETALKEHRAFAYAIFSSAGDPLLTDTFLPGDRSPDKIINMVTAFYGGGTDFKKPLSWALEKIKESAFNKADIVMITDGECAVGDNFLSELLAAKKEREFAIYSVLIGFNSYKLQRWSDQVWSVHNLLDASVAESLYQSI